jgi:dihydrodipicolinate synthase/N-acetylneuraminate lyase
VKPFTPDELFGNWATLLLPIDARDDIDFAALADEIDAIIAAGVNGVYSNGTAGEFHTQSEDEFDRVSALLAERCEAAGLPFQIGASHMSAQISRERLRRAKALRPVAFQVILPDWFPLSDDEAIAFLKTMAVEADPIGLVLYNPPHAKRVLAPEQIAMLADRVPALIGVKVAAGDPSWFARLGGTLRRISVFTPGHQLGTHLPLGSRGAYSNVACLSPAKAQAWYDTLRSDPSAGQQAQAQLQHFFQRYITPYITEQRYANAAVDKLLAAIGGWAPLTTRMRWPYRSIPAEDAVRLRAIARTELPDFIDADPAATSTAYAGRGGRRGMLDPREDA